MAGGFGTARVLGQNKEHERITRHSLQCSGPKSDGICFEAATLDQLAGRDLTFGAVGQPDLSEIMANDPKYHCDGGDYLPIIRYPEREKEARGAIERCRALMDSKLDEAAADAGALVAPPPGWPQPDAQIVPEQVNIGGMTGCVFVGGLKGVAKCNVLEDLGISLHVSQDFYSHTNWVDQPDPGKPQDELNPPGLNRRGPAPYLDLRGSRPFPDGLMSGCYGEAFRTGPQVRGKPESLGCRYGFLLLFQRVIHANVEKDEGVIDPVIGAGTTPRGAINDNFKHAVEAAIADTTDKWAILRERILAKYPKTGPLIICAIVRDDPVKDCQGRLVGLVIDSSGSNTTTDPQNRRITAGLKVIEMLKSQPPGVATGTPDRLAVVDFDDSATVAYPLGAPDGGAEAVRRIDSSGGTDIAEGINAALAAIAPAGPAPGKSGIVVLTDGEDPDTGPEIAAINAATAQGVRVSYALLAPPSQISEHSGQRSHAVPAELRRAVLASGGVFATVRTAADQEAFVGLVERRGLTGVDDPDGADDGGALSLGVEVTGTIGSPGDSDVWTYAAAQGEGVKLTVAPSSGLRARVQAVSADGRTSSAIGTAPGSAVALSAKASQAGLLRLSVAGAPAGDYTLKLEHDAAAPVLRPVRVRRIAPLAVALGPGRVSLTPRGRDVRRLRRGSSPFVNWRVRGNRSGVLRLSVTGPRGAHLTLRSRIRKGRNTVVAQLSILGSRKGPWRLRLYAGRSIIAEDALLTR